MTDLQAICDAAEDAFFRGEFETAMRRLSEAVPADALPVLLSRAKLAAHMIFLDGAPSGPAVEAATAALDIALRYDDRRAEIDARQIFGLSSYYRQIGLSTPDFAEARDAFARAQALADEHGTDCQRASAHFHVGLIQQMTYRDAAAEASFGRAYVIAKGAGCALEQSYAARHQGFYQRGRGDMSAALRSFRESLALRQQLDLRVYLPLSYLSLADTLRQAGNLDEAAPLFEQAERSADEVGLSRSIALVALAYGDFRALQDDPAAARACYERAVSFGRKAGHEVVVQQAADKLGAL